MISIPIFMRVLLLLPALVGLAGCSTSIYGWQVRTTSTPMADPFHPTDLEREPVAILDALASPGMRGNEEGLAMYLAQILGKVAPRIQVITPQATVTRINQKGLAQDYARMRAEAEQSYILDRHILQKLGAATGARFVFQPRLAAFSQTMTERWKVPGFDLRVVQTRSSLIRLSLQLWEIDTGKLVWHSVAEAILSNEAVSQDPVFMEEESKIALGGIVADFLYGRTASQYTPLNEVLNQLIEKPPPQPEKKPDTQVEPEGK